MALAIVLLLAALSCVHTASLPPHALDTMDKDSLEVDSITADRIRQTVLEGVKQLLDFQLAALKGIPRRRQVTPILRPRPIIIQSQKGMIDQVPQIKKEDLQNSEPVKVSTDESVQAPEETSIKQVLDESLYEKKEKLNKEIDDINLHDNIKIIDSVSNSIQNDNDKTVDQDTDVENKQTGNKHENSEKDNQIENELGKQRGPHIIYISNKQSNLDNFDEGRNIDEVINAIIDTKTLGSKILTSNRDKNEHSDGFKEHINEDNYKSKHSKDDAKVENEQEPSDNKVKTAFIKHDIRAIDNDLDLDDYIHIIDGLIEGDEKIKVENKELKEAYHKHKPKTKNNNNIEDPHVITINKFVNDSNVTKDNVNTNIEENNIRDEEDNIPLDNLSIQDINNLISSVQRFFQKSKNDTNPKDDINDESDVSDQVVIIGSEEEVTAGSGRKHVMKETDEEETGIKKSNNLIATNIGAKHNTCSVKDLHVPGKNTNYNNCNNQLEIDESKLMQKLFKNNEINKSLTFSLNFTYK